MGKTIGVIQARMNSQRLPGRIIAPLGGRPLLAQLVSRIVPARLDEWWLATSSDPEDDVTEAWGFELGLRVFRGDPTDILSQFVAIGMEAGAQWILRVMADSPFLDANLINLLLDARDATDESKRADALRLSGAMTAGDAAGDAGSTENTTESCSTSPSLPLGYGVELVRLSALERADREIPEDQFHHRVHVTSWLATNGSGSGEGRRAFCEVPTPSSWPDRPNWRWTIDTYQDLAMARSAFRVFGLETATIDYPTMVAHLDEHPEIAAMNRHIKSDILEDA